MSPDAENAAISARAEILTGLAAHFEFSRDEDPCLVTADNRPVQLAMRLTPVQCPERPLTVIPR